MTATDGLDAIAIADLVHTGEVTPVEVVTEAIERIEAANPILNAVIATDYDHALESARALDTARDFAGVPILVKDLACEVDGMPMREGSAFLAGYVSHGDQQYVARLRDAGFVILGKTNTPEFGMMPTTEPRVFGPTRNPWDTRFATGGSSGGAAAAVASGMVPVAHGNDVGGSIRIPASACGLFGLKPTRGRCGWGPRYGDVFGGMGEEHVLARSVRDSAALLDVTSGPAPGDPYSAPSHPGRWRDEVDRPPGHLRIAVTRTTPGDEAVHPDVLTALDEAIALLVGLGHDLVERDMTELDHRTGSAIGRMYGAATDWAIRYWERELGRPAGDDDLEPLTRLYRQRGAQVSGGELLLAINDLQVFTHRLAEATRDLDVWLSPTLSAPPTPVGHLVVDDPFIAEQRAAELVRYPLVVANITGRPAMSVPLHVNATGLPIGVHFLGNYGREDVLFRLAGQLEAASHWADRLPFMAPAVSTH